MRRRSDTRVRLDRSFGNTITRAGTAPGGFCLEELRENDVKTVLGAVAIQVEPDPRWVGPSDAWYVLIYTQMLIGFQLGWNAREDLR